MADKTQLALRAEAPFDFVYAAYSHGWVVLAPNAWDAERQAVSRAQRLPGGQVALLEMRGGGTPAKPEILVGVMHARPLSQDDEEAILDAVRHMFRLDEDLSEFYELCRQRGGRWNRLTTGLGRLLRSPTVFEDVVKTICTTNIQWGGTKRMVESLVGALGEPFPEDRGRRAFPTPEAVAAAPPETFSEAVRLGYRREYVHTLARRVASGDLDLQAFLDPSIPTDELKKELLAIKGIGNYAAATMLMLLGRYDELAVDTVLRQFVAQKYFHGDKPSDEQAKAVYGGWGRWKYLAYWFDIWEGLEEAL